MKTFYNLLVAEFKLQLWDKKKYPFRTIIQFFVLVFIIVGFFKGSEILSGESLMQLKPSLIISYIMFIGCVTQILSFPGTISGLREIGVLEQINLSPVKFKFILLAKIATKVVSKVISAVIMLYLIIYFANSSLSVNLGNFLFLFITALISVLGISFVLAGLELMYRKILQINFFIMILYGYLMTLEVYPLNFISFIPFIGAANTARKSSIGLEFYSYSWYLFIFVISIIHFVAGVAIFEYFEKLAKKKNSLCKI